MALVNISVTTNGVNTSKLELKGATTVKAYNNVGGTTSNFSCSAILKEQSISSNTDFITVTTGSEERNYKLPTNVDFTENNYQTYPIIVKANGSLSYATTSVSKRLFNTNYTNSLTKTGDGTVSFSSSNTNVATINSSGVITPIAAGTTTITATATDGTNYRYLTNTATYTLKVYKNEVKQVPLWYLSEYNINNSAGTSMATTSNAGYLFQWNTAMTTFTGATTSYDTYKKGNKTITNGGSYKYHMGIFSEWLSIIPAYGDHTIQTNLGDMSGYYEGLTVKFGYNTASKNGVSDKSWWKQQSGDGNEIHAIRFLGTEYCSAWKYKYASNTLTISATLIDIVDENANAAQSWYNSNWNSITFGNNETKYATQRTFYSYGYGGVGATPTNDVGKRALSWTTKESPDGTNAYIVNTQGDGIIKLYFPGSKKDVGGTVRLFRDN